MKVRKLASHKEIGFFILLLFFYFRFVIMYCIFFIVHRSTCSHPVNAGVTLLRQYLIQHFCIYADFFHTRNPRILMKFKTKLRVPKDKIYWSKTFISSFLLISCETAIFLYNSRSVCSLVP